MKKRILYIDVLRILACMAVIFNHTSEKGFYLFSTREWGSMLFYEDLLFSVACKFAVPVFFAISGALLLDKEITLKDLWRKKIGKIAGVLIVFSLLSYIGDAMQSGSAMEIKHFITQLYEDKLNYAFWYLYAYLAFLISLPMLSAMVKNMKDRQIQYALTIALFFRSLLPATEYFVLDGGLRIGQHLNTTWLMSDIVLYPVMGYYLHHRLNDREIKIAFPLLWCVAAAGMGITCVLTYHEFYVVWTPYIQSYHELFAGIYAAVIFVTVRYLFEHIQFGNSIEQILSALGKATLGVYLVHTFIIDMRLFDEWIWGFICLMNLPQMVCGWLYVGIVFLVSASIAMVLRKIPGFRWLLS